MGVQRENPKRMDETPPTCSRDWKEKKNIQITEVLKQVTLQGVVTTLTGTTGYEPQGGENKGVREGRRGQLGRNRHVLGNSPLAVVSTYSSLFSFRAF